MQKLMSKHLELINTNLITPGFGNNSYNNLNSYVKKKTRNDFRKKCNGLIATYLKNKCLIIIQTTINQYKLKLKNVFFFSPYL